MTTKHCGAIGLAWTNKHLCLLAHDDATYECVDPSDSIPADGAIYSPGRQTWLTLIATGNCCWPKRRPVDERR
jgi:hypothetical protein